MGRSRSPSTSPKAPPTPTDLNLSALEDALAEAPDGTIRRVPAVHAPHLRRCIDAGLLEPAGARAAWCLSAAGVTALAARRSRLASCFVGFRPQFLHRELLMETVARAVNAQQLTTAEGVILLSCWDHPSTMPETVQRLGMPPVFAEALAPGRFTTEEARAPFTLAELLAANRDWPLHPTDLTAIASLHPGDTHELHQGACGNTVLRCEGAPLHQRGSTFARRLSNLLACYGKVLHVDADHEPPRGGSEPAPR